MKTYSIDTPYFNKETSCMYTFESVGGDKIALNHIPPGACDLYYSQTVDDILSFVIFDMKTCSDYSFALLKPSNISGIEKGVEIIAIGYNGEEALDDLINQMQFHVFRQKQNGEYKYDYIWSSSRVFGTMPLCEKYECYMMYRDDNSEFL